MQNLNSCCIRPAMPTDDECWQAVMSRDAAFDDVFVYAVTSTGIYCRPACPSRRPRREHVRFYATSSLAEHAGFRACRRCRPDSTVSANSVSRIVKVVYETVDDCPEITPDLAALGRLAGVSPGYLQKVFKQVTGITPRQYADARRVELFKARLRDGCSISGATYDSGYGSSSRVYGKASIRLGITPGTYRRGGKGAQITYTISDCPIGGSVLVAATERGVCAISMGDDEKSLEAALRTEFYAAEIMRDNSTLKDLVEAVLCYLSGKTRQLNLPLDVQATAFERLVWEYLKGIPLGETCSYSDIATALGRPAAVRAVARACAANKVALAIPCHRALRKDGGLGGYRWGLKRKEALLAREKESAASFEDAPYDSATDG